MIPRSTLPLLVAIVSLPVFAQPADPAVEKLLPVPEEARRILDQRCVLCHGEVIDGEAEIREDLDLSSDEAIRSTLVDVETLIEMIVNDEMPHEAKLSFRLRKRGDMQERLRTLKEEYEASDEKEKLLSWLQPAAGE